MIFNRSILSFLTLVATTTLFANDSIPSAEDLVGSGWVDQQIETPESVNTNLDSLLRAWHFKTYRKTTYNGTCDSVNPVVPDSVIIHRLASIPAVIPMTYNSVVKQFIDMYGGRKRSQVEVMLGLSDYYFPYFIRALERHQLPLELRYLPIVESALNPNAVSRAGATGLWQFMYGTGKIYGLDINTLIDERRDPIASSEAAARYLKDLYQIFGDWHLAIAAYNCGPGNVNKAIRRAGGKRNYWDIYYYLPSETRGYVPLFIAANYIMRYHKEHRICPIQMDLTSMHDTMIIQQKMHFEQISTLVGVSMEELKSMNPQYRQNIIPGSQEKPLVLCLPAEYSMTFVDFQDSIPNYRAQELLYADMKAGPSIGSSGANGYIVYEVRKGDTLSRIAQRHRVSVSKLKNWNNIHTSRIYPGQRLKIY
jgi:membrane-bound lytic murein transglycosylase D